MRKFKTKSLQIFQNQDPPRNDKSVTKSPTNLLHTPKVCKIGPSLIIKSPASSTSKKFFAKSPSRNQEAAALRRTQNKHSSVLESSSSNNNCTLDLQGIEEHAASNFLFHERSLSLLSTPFTPQYHSAKKISFHEMKSNLFQKFVRLQKGFTSTLQVPPQKYVATLNSELGEEGNNEENFDAIDETGLVDRRKFLLKEKERIVRGYAANTNEGTLKSCNEDRVSIVVNIMKPPHLREEDEWPSCSFFGIYDGHGGVECAEFLQNNLYQLIIKDMNFPLNPVEAIRNGFREAERQFLEFAQQQKQNVNKSGSCAIIALIIGILFT